MSPEVTPLFRGGVSIVAVALVGFTLLNNQITRFEERVDARSKERTDAPAKRLGQCIKASGRA